MQIIGKDILNVLLLFMLRAQLAEAHDDDWKKLDDDSILTSVALSSMSPSSFPNMSPSRFQSTYPIEYPSSRPAETPQGIISRSICRVSESGYYGDQTTSNYYCQSDDSNQQYARVPPK